MSSARLSNQSLQWTRPLLDELCDNVRQAVERFGDEDVERQEGELDSAIEACEKVAGSLAVMQFDSGQLIAEAMAMALTALQNGKAADESAAISSVLEATAILPDYLDYLESTQRDAPIVALPTINDLRTVAGAKPLEESAYFRPEVGSVELPDPATEDQGRTDIRRDYQHALRGILLNNQDTEAMEKLASVTLQVRDRVTLPASVRRAGWAAAAACEALKEQHIAGGPATTRLFARMDVMLKEVLDNTDPEKLDSKADDLTRGFLFQVASARSDSAIAREVHQAFKLEEQAPEQMIQAKVFLAGRNRALFAAVTQAAREDLARIKDALGSQLERDNDPEVLEQQTALLESVGESLGMLGLDHLSVRVKAQAKKLGELSTDPDDPTLLRVARELLVVESQLEESFGLAAEMGPDAEPDDNDTLLPPSERRRVVKQLVKEALEDLAHAKHLLDAVNRQKADANAVTEAQTILGRIAGALHVSGLEQAAILLESASRIAGDYLGAPARDNQAEALETLAETLTVAEFYLESLSTLDERGERYLESARTRLKNLGYWPDHDPASDTDQVDEAIGETEAETGKPAESPVLDELDTDDDSLADFDFEEAPESLDIDDDELSIDDEREAIDLEMASDELLDEELASADAQPGLDDGGKSEEDPLGAESESATEATDAEELAASWDKQPEETLDADDEPLTAETEERDSGLSSAFDDFDIVEIFLEEFDQELESLEELVPRWQDNPNAEEDTITIRRAFHSLKGSGRMAGATEIGEFAWRLESLLNRIIDRQVEATPKVTGLVAESVAALPSMRARLSGDGPGEYDEQTCSDIAAKAERISDGQAEEASTGAAMPAELEDLDPTLIELMIKELSENLETLEGWLAEADESGHVEAVDERLVRVVHTMKGTMRLAPIGDETETAQILEAYLEELSLCVAPPSRAGLNAMSRSAELFRHRLRRLQGESVEDALFQTAELADELRAMHNKAHRDRTGEHAPSFTPIPSMQDRGPDRDEALSDEPAFSSELGDEATVESRDDDFDVFDVDDEEVAADEEDLAELTEGEPVEEATSDSSPDADEAVDDAQTLDETTEAGAVEPAASDQDDEEILAQEATADQTVDDESVDDESWDEEATDEEAVDEQSSDAVLSEETSGEVDEEAEASIDEESADEEVVAEDLIDEESVDDVPADEVPADEVPVDEASVDEVPDEVERTVLDSQFVPERFEAEPDRGAATSDADADFVKVDYSEVNEDLLEAFLEEGQELLEHSDGLLQKWREAPSDKSLVTALQRDLHTIKGSSRMVGLNPIGQVAHVMEELLEGIATGLKEPTQERINALETGCDQLHSMIDAVLKRAPMPMRSLTEMFAEQAEEMDDAVILPERDKATEQTRQDDDETSTARAETLRVPSSLIDELVNYAGEISIFRSRLEQQVSVFRNNVGEVDETVIRLRDQLRKLEIETEAQILARYEREHGPSDEAFDPLELDRYSTIQQLSRALAESVNDLTSLTGILDDATRQSETLLMQQSRVNTELQEGLMQARMVSFNTLLPRFRRVIRNAAREVGKKVQLQVDLSGESELDRNVLDRVTAPLEHLLRNAVSHGIEDPDKRRQRGKPETGTISIEVSREATELVMRVFDDGAGLDLDAIEKRAKDRGLIESGENVSDQALIQMIFRSGFSTAAQVSELSGRGIGMDVVANEVRQIGGSVSASSEEGQGAQFVIRIPLSLTVMQAIMVRASDRSFAIPLQAVRGVTRILADEWLREIEGPEPQQEYAGEQYPLLELEPQLDLASEEVSSGTLSLLMIEAGAQRAALRVTELLGHREIVIKPVGPQISSIPGILGGTITGDGQVIPILDMGPLIRRAFERDLIPGLGAVQEARKTQEIKRMPLVMVVDDSITMRRVTSRVLEHRGLEVTTARDGLDAVEAMFDRVPDLILLDIEMPRMDGYELASHVRNDPRLKEVPMMMITSRSGEKHRQRARELGVDDYLAKPYQEAELVQHVFELLKLTVPEG